MRKGLIIASWVCLGIGALLAVTALLSGWAVNAEIFGARDLGLAVFLAFLNSAAFIGATCAAPVLVLGGLFAQRLNKQSGLRMVAAGAMCAVPLAWYTWL